MERLSWQRHVHPQPQQLSQRKGRHLCSYVASSWTKSSKTARGSEEGLICVQALWINHHCTTTALCLVTFKNLYSFKHFHQNNLKGDTASFSATQCRMWSVVLFYGRTALTWSTVLHSWVFHISLRCKVKGSHFGSRYYSTQRWVRRFVPLAKTAAEDTLWWQRVAELIESLHRFNLPWRLQLIIPLTCLFVQRATFLSCKIQDRHRLFISLHWRLQFVVLLNCTVLYWQVLL